MVPRTDLALVFFLFVGLVGCNSHQAGSETGSQVAASTGLRSTDEAGIKADAKARLLTRTIGMAALGDVKPCTNFFSLGEPQILDSTLGDQTGKVQVMVPVIVENAWNNGNGQMTVPDMQCYGFSHPGWKGREPYNVSFEFQIERWQSGWRIAQIQANGF